MLLNDLQESQKLATLAQNKGAKVFVALSSMAASKGEGCQAQHLILHIYQSRRLIAWQAKEIIDTAALDRVLNTTFSTSTSLWQSPPIKMGHIYEPKVVE